LHRREQERKRVYAKKGEKYPAKTLLTLFSAVKMKIKPGTTFSVYNKKPVMANNKNTDEEKDFPGYPHYPAREDILNQPDAERVDLDVENLSRSRNQSSSALHDRFVKVPAADDQPVPVDDIDDDAPVPGTEADVTSEDLIALGEQDADFGRREELAVTGDDLDVPGSEDDDNNEDIGEEDEENNYYSLGGDAHENLEEDKS